MATASVGRQPGRPPRQRRPVDDYVIGVDGGNSKTDIVLAALDGTVLAWSRGPGVGSPLENVAQWRDGLVSLVLQARQLAGIAGGGCAASAAYCLANVDLPAERRLALRVLTDAGLSARTVVHNDTVAILRAGAARRWGVAVVAGAGINALGVHPFGRVARFLAFGDYTGDSGGGLHLGIQGLGAAVRARDGRGPATTLVTAVPAHFGLRTPEQVAIAVHSNQIAYTDLHVLAPAVLAAATAGDGVARRLVDGFADEVVSMAAALIRRLHLTRTDVEVVLGGSVLQSSDRTFVDRIGDGVHAVAADAQVTVLSPPPVFGAVVEALDGVAADRSAAERVLAGLSATS
jgi:N-acetylglucosamine kinase-like BadF-type ATPase